jgi:hypothetical protein
MAKGKAKTASKNNPTARQKAKDVFYNSKKVVPVMLISDNGRKMVAQFEDGNLAEDVNGHPVPWERVSLQ